MISVTDKPFNPATEIETFEKGAQNAGAIVSFTGKVRDTVSGGARSDEQVTGLFLDHFPGMTERSIEKFVDKADERWNLIAIRIIHRYGLLKPDEPIVLVCTASAHRRDAFEAADFLMDVLKTRALFWKKEISGNHESWIEPREADYQDALRWSPE